MEDSTNMNYYYNSLNDIEITSDKAMNNTQKKTNYKNIINKKRNII